MAISRKPAISVYLRTVMLFGLCLLALLIGIRSIRYLTLGSVQDAAKREFTANAPLEWARSFKVLRTFQWGHRSVVLYRTRWLRGVSPDLDTLQSSPGATLYGWMSYNLGFWTGWTAAGGGWLVSTKQSQSQLVEMAAGYGYGDNGEYTYVIGHTSYTTPATLVARFNTGQVINTTPLDGVFLSLASGTKAVCSVKILNTTGRKLEDYNVNANSFSSSFPVHCS